MKDPACDGPCGRTFAIGEIVYCCHPSGKVLCAACFAAGLGHGPRAAVSFPFHRIPASPFDAELLSRMEKRDAAVSREIDRQMEKVEQAPRSPMDPWAVCGSCGRDIFHGQRHGWIRKGDIACVLCPGCNEAMRIPTEDLRAFPPTHAESVEAQLREMGVKW